MAVPQPGLVPDDVFEAIYHPRKVEFWLDHFIELDTLVMGGRSAAHIAEHLNREWILLQVRMKTCLCDEMHAIDSMVVDPGCVHVSGGRGFKAGPENALCISADLRRAAEQMPANWLATHRVWEQTLVPSRDIARRRALWRQEVLAGRASLEPEPLWARSVVIKRMALLLGWRAEMPAS